MEGTTGVGQELWTDVCICQEFWHMYPRTVSTNWDLCLHILFTRHRLVPILHLEWYLNHYSMLTQQNDSYLMESFPQVCMQNAVLGIQSFFRKCPHGMVKGLGLLILSCLSLLENQFTSLVFFAYNFSPKWCFYINVTVDFEISPHTQRAKRDWRKRQITPYW